MKPRLDRSWKRLAALLVREGLADLSRGVGARLAAIPHRPVCNLRRDRAPCVGPVCSPLCWRCLAAMFTLFVPGDLLGTACPAGYRVAFVVALALPATADGLAQYALGRESTNVMRAATGALLGLALAATVPFLGG